jgi:hypothetical protein
MRNVYYRCEYKHMHKLSAAASICRAWGSFRENTRSSAKKSLGVYEMKQHKPSLMKSA